ncbi:MAG: hypothetical protein HOQ18_06540 [Dermatophilaceae bacterium]|nr:hypothetical protein [Dermatophilaceae bacterium]
MTRSPSDRSSASTHPRAASAAGVSDVAHQVWRETAARALPALVAAVESRGGRP